MPPIVPCTSTLGSRSSAARFEIPSEGGSGRRRPARRAVDHFEGLPHDLHVLLRHRLLRQSGGFEDSPHRRGAPLAAIAYRPSPSGGYDSDEAQPSSRYCRGRSDDRAYSPEPQPRASRSARPHTSEASGSHATCDTAACSAVSTSSDPESKPSRSCALRVGWFTQYPRAIGRVEHGFGVIAKIAEWPTARAEPNRGQLTDAK